MAPPKKVETEDERGRRIAQETLARESLGPLRQRVDIFTRAGNLLAGKGEPDYSGPFHQVATTFAVLTGQDQLRPAQVALLLLIAKTTDDLWDYDSPDNEPF